MKPARFDPFLGSAILCMSACLLVAGAGFHAVFTKQEATPLVFTAMILSLGAQVFVRVYASRRK